MIEEVFLLVVFIFALTSSLIGFIIAHGYHDGYGVEQPKKWKKFLMIYPMYGIQIWKINQWVK